MKLNKLNILLNLMFALMIGVGVSAETTYDPVVIGLSVFAVTTGPQILFPKTFNCTGVVMATIRTEVWTADIKEKLFANNEFMLASTNHNAFVNNKTVNVPQSGTNPAVVKNRTVLPAAIGQRTDTNLTYDLNEFTTDPILIQNTEDIQVSYNKRQSVMSQHVRTINDRIARDAIINWAAPSAKVVLTTGGTSLFQPAGSTGSRKKLTILDLAELQRIAANDDFASDGWNILLTNDVYSELITDSSNRALNRDFMNQGNLATGAVNMIHGFNIFLRSTVASYDSGNTVKAFGAAGAAGDSFGLIGWHRDAVAQATGSIEVFSDEKKPEFFGDILSALVLHGSESLREDNAGIVALVQGTV